VGQKHVIGKTVQQLSRRNAALMFASVVDRLQSRPARAAMLLPWLRALLLHHSSSLAASSGTKWHLNVLRDLLKARVALLQPMLDLSGRLDFMLAHASRQPSAPPSVSTSPLVCLHWCLPSELALSLIACQSQSMPLQLGLIVLCVCF
jgi:hypothetical protein